MNRRVRDALLFVVGVAILSALALYGSREPQQEVSIPSITDDGSRGSAAWALLLEHEHFTVSANRARLTDLRGRAQTLVMAGTESDIVESPTLGERAALFQWVRGGGHLVLVGSPLGAVLPRKQTELPRSYSTQLQREGTVVTRFAVAFPPRAIRGTFKRAYVARKGDVVLARSPAGIVALRHRIDKGDVTVISSVSTFSNAALAQADNARFAVAIVPTHRVLFDEALFGYGSDRGMWEVLTPPLRAAVILASLLLLLAIVGNLLPFAPPLARAIELRRTSAAYLDSLARLLHAGRARRHAIAGFADAARQRLRGRPASGAVATTHSRLMDIAARLQPSDGDVLDAARLYAHIRKELP